MTTETNAELLVAGAEIAYDCWVQFVPGQMVVRDGRWWWEFPTLETATTFTASDICALIGNAFDGNVTAALEQHVIEAIDALYDNLEDRDLDQCGTAEIDEWDCGAYCKAWHVSEVFLRAACISERVG